MAKVIFQKKQKQTALEDGTVFKKTDYEKVIGGKPVSITHAQFHQETREAHCISVKPEEKDKDVVQKFECEMAG